MVAGSSPLSVQVGEASISGDVEVEASIEGIDDGVLANFEALATADLACTRCLESWEEPVTARSMQVYEPQPDEDGYGLDRDNTIDLFGPVRDEVALALPVRPLCRPDCRGLCPTCGTDLNKDPCDGHADLSDSPFAALQELFDSPES